MELKKDWKTILKARRKEIYQKMKASRKEYMNRPEIKEKMQIAKFKMKNKRKAFMEKIREEKNKNRSLKFKKF